MPAIGHEQQQQQAERHHEPASQASGKSRGEEVTPPEVAALRNRLLARLGSSPEPRAVVEALRQFGALSLPRGTIASALQGDPFGNHLTSQVMPLLDGPLADAGAREPSSLGAAGLGGASASVNDSPPTAAGAAQHYAKAAFYKRQGGRRHLVKFWDGPTYDMPGLRDRGRFKKGRWTWDHDDKVRVINLRSAQDPGSGESMEEAAKRWGATEIDYQTFTSQKDSTQLGEYDTNPDSDAEGDGQKAARPSLDPKDLDVDTVNALPPDVLENASRDAMAPRRTTGEEGGEEGGVLEGGVSEGGSLEGSAEGDAVNGVDGGKGKKGNRGRKDGDKRGVSEATRIGKQKDRGGGEGKDPVWYGSKSGTGQVGGTKQSMRDVMNWITRGWWKKHAPAVEVPEKVAVAIDIAATMKDAIEIAAVFGAAMGLPSLGEFLGLKGSKEGVDLVGEEALQKAAKTQTGELAEEAAEGVAKTAKKGRKAARVAGEEIEEGAEAAGKTAKKGRKAATEGAEEAEEGAEAAGKKSKDTTRAGVKRTNRKDWRKFRDSMEAAPQYRGILSDANKKLISQGRVPIIDDVWVEHFPGMKKYLGEEITMHHIKASKITVPLGESMHIDAHMPGGTSVNPGGPGMTGALEVDLYGDHA